MEYGAPSFAMAQLWAFGECQWVRALSVSLSVPLKYIEKHHYETEGKRMHDHGVHLSELVWPYQP